MLRAMVSRSRLKSVLTGLALYAIAAAMIGYFGVNAYTGRYGLNAQQELDQEIIALTSELARLKRERAQGEQRVSLLRSDRVDPDMLDERARYQLDYVNPHATATPIGDLREIEALREVFGAKCPPISATKSLTGHSLGAAGVQEAIYSLLMMNNGFICESANIETLDPAFEDMPIVRERRDNMALSCVLSNSFGFGGTNASIVLKRLDA